MHETEWEYKNRTSGSGKPIFFNRPGFRIQKSDFVSLRDVEHLMNPWEFSSQTQPGVQDTVPDTPSWSARWLVRFSRCAAVYWCLSVLTLPFVDIFWMGEMAILAPIQLPKSGLKAHVQDVMVSLLPVLGLARGSRSPDLILTHPWAMGVMLAAPAILLLCLLVSFPSVPQRHRRILIIFLLACADAAVTVAFCMYSRLSIF
jgi:hypothetical protein